jgi:hypothetical protein
MGKTSWARNWGNFERVEWVDDEVDKARISVPPSKLDAAADE